MSLKNINDPLRRNRRMRQPGANFDAHLPNRLVSAIPPLGRPNRFFDYSRSSNPTRLVLEEDLAKADGGYRASPSRPVLQPSTS